MPMPILRSVLACVLLSGCGQILTESTSDVAGVAGAGIAGAVTDSATAGAAIGLGVRSLADSGLQYAERRVHREEQDRIAAAAGALPEGAAGVWSVSHDVPIEPDAHGAVVVTRILAARPSSTASAGFTCKEIIFSVEGGSKGVGLGFYTAAVCLDGARWKWASAEPATERWGNLQ